MKKHEIDSIAHIKERILDIINSPSTEWGDFSIRNAIVEMGDNINIRITDMIVENSQENTNYHLLTVYEAEINEIWSNMFQIYFRMKGTFYQDMVNEITNYVWSYYQHTITAKYIIKENDYALCLLAANWI